MTCVAVPHITAAMFGWSITEELTTVSWSAPRTIEADKRTAVAAALEADAGKVPVASDPYFFGKQVPLLGAIGLASSGCQTLAEDVLRGLRPLQVHPLVWLPV